MNSRLLRCQQGMVVLVTVLALSVGVGRGGDAESDSQRAEEAADTSHPVYQLSFPQDDALLIRPPSTDDWRQRNRQLDYRSRALIKVVELSQVDQSLYVDTCGLRLYADSPACQKLFRDLPQDSTTTITLAWLARDLLGRRYAATGVEPEMIPIRNSVAKECGVQGLVQLKGGGIRTQWPLLHFAER